MLDVLAGTNVRAQKNIVAAQKKRALTGLSIDGPGEYRIRTLDDGVTALDIAHVANDTARAFVGERPDQYDEHRRNDCQHAALSSTENAWTQAVHSPV